jgi:hypothetical protein
MTTKPVKSTITVREACVNVDLKIPVSRIRNVEPCGSGTVLTVRDDRKRQHRFLTVCPFHTVILKILKA